MIFFFDFFQQNTNGEGTSAEQATNGDGGAMEDNNSNDSDSSFDENKPPKHPSGKDCFIKTDKTSFYSFKSYLRDVLEVCFRRNSNLRIKQIRIKPD